MSFFGEIWRNKWFKLVLALVATALCLYLLGRLVGMLTALALAVFLTYISSPITDFFVKRLKLPRTLAAILVIVLILAAVIAFFAIIIPIFARQVGQLGSNIPAYVQRVQVAALPYIVRWLDALGLTIPTSTQELMDEIKQNQEAIRDIGAKILAPVYSAAKATFSSVVNILLGLLNMIIVPVAWFYLLRDWEKIKQRLLEMVPVAKRPSVAGSAAQIHKVLTDFMSGQLVACLVLGLLYAVGLQFVAKVPLGFLLGIIAGLLSIVPYLGVMVSILPAMALAFLEHADWQHPALVVAVFATAHALEDNLIAPKIIGEKLGLHPLTIILSLLIFGEFFGFFGILIAVPCTAVIMVFVRQAEERYKKSAYYSAED